MRFAPLVSLLALGTLTAPPAAADDKRQCVEAYKEAQVLRRVGDYTAARDQLLVCSRESCPPIIKQDCVPWLGEITRGIASVIVTAKDPAGHALDRVKLSIDGKLVTTELDGRPIELSPGARALRLETEGAPAVEQSITLREGERNHSVDIVLAVPVAPAAPAQPEPTRRASRPLPPGAIVLGVVGVVGIGTFATLGLLGSSKKSSLDTCKPGCNPDDVSVVRTDYVAADIALGVGGAALAGAVVWYLLRPEAPRDAPSVGARALPGGAVLTLAASF